MYIFHIHALAERTKWIFGFVQDVAGDGLAYTRLNLRLPRFLRRDNLYLVDQVDLVTRFQSSPLFVNLVISHRHDWQRS